ncbi:MAG: hypothetical protein JKY65_22880 [Planctomycetes bacterium]|nr:hypothetical protein [Planctomycetota bacterium]
MSPLPVLLLACCAPLAVAQQAAPTAEVTIKLGPGKGGAVLSLDGKAANLPDGTKLHVRMVVAEVKVEASFFMTPVTSERFRAVKRFNNRTLAPLPYVITVELILADQRQAIGQLIRREWGLPSGARVILAKQRINIGTLEEQAKFRVETIHKLLGFTAIALDCVAKTVEIMDTPAPEDKKEWQKVLVGLAKYVRPKFVRPFDRFKAIHVVLHENKALSTLYTCVSTLHNGLELHKKKETAKGRARMDRVKAQLQRLKEELESRLPKKKKGEGAK